MLPSQLLRGLLWESLIILLIRRLSVLPWEVFIIIQRILIVNLSFMLAVPNLHLYETLNRENS